jgi:hypothetical protein
VYRFALVVTPGTAGYDDKIIGHMSTDGTVTIDRRIAGNGSNHFFSPAPSASRGTRGSESRVDPSVSRTSGPA